MFKTVCLTGGPCAGKTSAVSILSDFFQALGWRVYKPMEAATVLFSAGVSFPELSPAAQYSFNKSILQTLLQIEQAFRDLATINAQEGVNSVVIFDRGAMDPSAYMTRQEWITMLTDLNLDEVALRDTRYDVVVHLVTAAKGAEAFYSLDTNNTRTEGISLARELDSKTLSAWNGHASLLVIDNESVANFAEKCDMVVQGVSSRLGLIDPKRQFGKMVRKLKFVIDNFTLTPDFPVEYKDFSVEHYYLVNTNPDDHAQTRIRRRQELGSAQAQTLHYNLTTRHAQVNGQKVETRRHLSAREFDTLLKTSVDPGRAAIRKIRRCFLWRDRYFQLDVYQSPHPGLVILETYQPSPGEVPQWLHGREVTDDKAFSMFNLAIERRASESVAPSSSKE